MSKNKTDSNDTEVLTVTDYDKQLADLRKQISDIASQREAAAAKAAQAVNEQILKLPEQFGVENVEAVYQMIGKYVRSTREGKTGRTVIPEATKDTIRQMLKGEIVNENGKKFQLSEIAAKTDVSTPTIMKIKGELGLVNRRNSEAGTPAPETVEATA